MFKGNQSIPFKKTKNHSNFEEGDSEWNRKCNYVIMLYLLKLFFQFDHCLSENTYCNKERYRSRQWDTKSIKEFVYEDTLNKLRGSRDYTETCPLCFNPPKHELTGRCKKWLLTVPHDKRTSRRSRTTKRPINRNLDEEIAATAVEVHPAPGNLTQQTARGCQTW